MMLGEFVTKRYNNIMVDDASKGDIFCDLNSVSSDATFETYPIEEG
jgi:hypothetical protein